MMNRAMRQSARLSTALHEAGHAVIARSLGLKVHSATIVPAPGIDGKVEHANPLRGIHLDYDGSDRARRRAEIAIIVCLAGPAAQRRHKP
jgi:ATP-dependent Zn protease